MIWVLIILGLFAFAWALLADGPWLSDKKKEKMQESKTNKLVMIIGFIFAAIFIIGTLSEVFKWKKYLILILN